MERFPEGYSSREVQNFQHRDYLPKEPSKEILAQLGFYLSAVGNHEAKALTLLCFNHTAEIVGRNELNRRIVRFTSDVWIQNPMATQEYCQGSFEKMELVTREIIDKQNNHYGYSLTNIGLEIGQPLAAYLLLKGFQYGISLYELFGATVSFTDNRAPKHSFAILNTLAVHNGPMRRDEIIALTQINPNTVTDNLRRLSKNGLIDYQRASAENQGYSKYRVSDLSKEAIPRAVGRAASLTREIWAVLLKNPDHELSRYDIAAIIRNDPELFAKFGHLNKLETAISNVLGGLKQQKMVTPSAINKEIRSLTSLSPSILPFIADVFPRLIAFFEKDESVIKEFDIAKASICAELDEGKYIRATEMLRAKEKSPYSPLNTRDRAEHSQIVYDYLQEHPNSRPLQMADALGLSVSNTLRALTDLMTTGTVVKVKEGRAMKYRLGKK